MAISFYSPDDWKKYSRESHLLAFNEDRSPEMERIDYAMIVGDGNVPWGYITVREIDAESAYVSYGGSFPGTKGTTKAVSGYRELFDYLASKYDRATTLIENTNRPMLKMAMQFGWLIKGIRYFKGSILLEHQIEFGG